MSIDDSAAFGAGAAQEQIARLSNVRQWNLEHATQAEAFGDYDAAHRHRLNAAAIAKQIDSLLRHVSYRNDFCDD
jgi:hypothetical protein